MRRFMSKSSSQSKRYTEDKDDPALLPRKSNETVSSEVAEEELHNVVEGLYEPVKKPTRALAWWWSFHLTLAPGIRVRIRPPAILLTGGLIAGTVLLHQHKPELMFLGHTLWCWLGLAACVYPASLTAHLMVLLLVRLLEYYFFTTPWVIFFVVGVQSAVSLVLWAAQLLAVFIGVFIVGNAWQRSSDVMLKLLICLQLFTVAILLTRVCERLVWLRFYEQAYFKRMHEALKMEYYLVLLAQPRNKVQNWWSHPPATAGAKGGHSEAAVGAVELSSDVSSPAPLPADSMSLPPFRAPSHSHATDMPATDARVDLSLGAGAEAPFPDKSASLRVRTVSAPQIKVVRPPPSPGARSEGPLPSPGGVSDSGSGGANSNAQFRRDRSRRGSNVPMQVQELSMLHTVIEQAEMAEMVDTDGEEMMAPARGGLQLAAAMDVLSHHIKNTVLSGSFTKKVRKGKWTAEQQEQWEQEEGARVGTYLFWNIKEDENRNYLIQEDLMPSFSNKENAEEAFQYLDVNGDEQVTLAELRERMAEIFKERSILAAALRGNESAVGELGRVIGICIHAVFIFIYILVFGAFETKTVVALSTFILGLTFIFKDYAANLFSGVMFLFVVRPFEVGDWILLNEKFFGILRIKLQHTVMVRGDTTTVVINNAELSKMELVNLSKSTTRREEYSVLVDLDTDVEKLLADATDRIAKFLTLHPDKFMSDFDITMKSIQDPLKAEIHLVYLMAQPGQQFKLTRLSRSLIFQCLASILRDHNVTYTLPSFRDTTTLPSTPFKYTAALLHPSATAAPPLVPPIVTPFH